MLLGTLGAILLGNMSTGKGMLRGGYRDKEGIGIWKMNKYSSIETYDTSNLSDQTKFRVNAIIKIEDYFYSEIQEKKLMSKKHCKYTAASDYIDKILIVLSVTSGGISIISFPSYIGVPAGMASASFTLIFSLTIGIIKKLSEITRNKKKKHKKIVVLAKNKLNSIEILICQALIDLDSSHEEFKIIVNEKEKYEKMKENIRTIKNSDELSEKYKNIIENRRTA